MRPRTQWASASSPFCISSRHFPWAMPYKTSSRKVPPLILLLTCSQTMHCPSKMALWNKLADCCFAAHSPPKPPFWSTTTYWMQFWRKFLGWPSEDCSSCFVLWLLCCTCRTLKMGCVLACTRARTLPPLDHAPIRQRTPTRSPDTHEEP